MKSLVSAFALIAGLSAPASAADIYSSGSVKDPAIPTLVLPEGAYVSVGIGTVLADTSVSGSAVFKTDNIGLAGFLGEVRVGYDFRSAGSPYIVGVLGGVSFEDANSSVHFTNGKNLLSTGTNQVFGYEIGARFGRIFNNSSLLYGLVAYQGQHVGVLNTGFSTDLSGVKVGGGIEVDLTNHYFFASEVDGIWYGDYTPATGWTLSQDEIRATARLGYRF